jgi:hypothetical protein
MLAAAVALLLAATVPVAGAEGRHPSKLGWCATYGAGEYSLAVGKIKGGSGWYFTLFKRVSNNLRHVATYRLWPVQRGAFVGAGWRADVLDSAHCPAVYR